MPLNAIGQLKLKNTGFVGRMLFAYIVRELLVTQVLGHEEMWCLLTQKSMPKMSNRRPWMKFNPTLFRNDPQLRLCSLGARGLWIEMICLMHDCIPYGHLMMGNRGMTMKELSKIVSETEAKVIRFASELESKRVFSRAENGVIFCRKMVRDFAFEARASELGKLGGNPKLMT